MNLVQPNCVKFLKKIGIGFGAILALTLSLMLPAYAVSDATPVLHGIAEGTGQSGYEKSERHDQASTRPGSESITSVFLFIGDYFVLITTSLAVLYLILAFVKLIYAGDSIEEAITKQKNNIKWIMMGLVVIVLADELVFDVFFGAETGSNTQPGQGWQSVGSIQVLAREFIKETAGLYNAIELYVVYLAVLVIIISGFRMIAQSSNEEATTAAKKHVFVAAVGLVIIGLSEGLVYLVYPAEDKPFDTAGFFEMLANITLFITSFISFLAVSVMAYGGYLYVFYYGQDDVIEKAKKVMKGAIIALVLSSLSYGIVYTAISLEPTTDKLEVVTAE